MPGIKNKRKKIHNNNNNRQTKKNRKVSIPKAIREQCWKKSFGDVFKHKCYVHWCDNEIDVLCNFEKHIRHKQNEFCKHPQIY